MARNKNSVRRYWPIIVLALLMAERAHAPWVGGAHASSKTDGSGRGARAVITAPPATTQKATPGIESPSAIVLNDPSKIQKKLQELEAPTDTSLLWNLDPLLVPPRAEAPLISLLHTTQLGALPVNDGIDLPASGGGLSNDAIDPVPPATLPKVYGGDVSDFGSGSGAATVAPIHHEIAVSGVVAIPEPEMLPVVLGGWRCWDEDGERKVERPAACRQHEIDALALRDRIGHHLTLFGD